MKLHRHTLMIWITISRGITLTNSYEEDNDMLELLDKNHGRIKSLYRFTTTVITWATVIWMHHNGFIFFVAR